MMRYYPEGIHAGQAFSFSATGYTPPPANNFLVDETDTGTGTGTPDQVSTDYTNFLYGSGEDNACTLAVGG